MFKPKILKVNNEFFQIEPLSIFLHVIAFIFLVASISDGFNPLFAALLIMIFDAIRYPYPNIENVTEEVGDSFDDDDMGPT